VVKKGEGSAGALPSRPGLKPSGAVSVPLAEVELLEARPAAVGGEVNDARRSVVDHERVAVQHGEAGREHRPQALPDSGSQRVLAATDVDP
jgi:hypothetical protein